MIDLVYLRQRAVVHSRMKKAPHLTMMEKSDHRSEEWRRFGRARRKEIVEQDILVGGNQFEMNVDCPVERYFDLADRVVQQFRAMCESLEMSTLEKTYIMGHRLVSFLSEALPSHPHYMDPTMDQYRSETIRDLVWIQQRLEEIAYRFDEEQLNHYIMDEYVPEPDENDDSTTCSTTSDEAWSSDDAQDTKAESLPVSNDGGWESFEGWSTETTSTFLDIPHLIESDGSLNSSTDTPSLEELPQFDLPAASFPQEEPASLEEPPRFDSPVSFPQEEPHGDYNDHESVEETGTECADPELDMDIMDDDEGDDVEDSLEFHLPLDLSEIQQAVRSSAFLRMVSEQDVPFEWDTDASDSWAQEIGDDDDSDCSIDSDDEQYTCDPARLALREIKRNVGYPDVSVIERDHFPSCLPKSLTFEEDMPDDEATWSAGVNAHTTNDYAAGPFQPFCDDDAPDDEAESWASFSVTEGRQQRSRAY